MKRVRIGILGCGRVAEGYHLPALKATTNSQVVSLFDKDPVRMETVAKQFMLNASTSTNLDDVLNDESVDAVLVLTPPQYHAAICEKAIIAGKHVFCEKPFTLTVEEALKIKDCLDMPDKKIQFSIGFNYRYHPFSTTSFSLIQNNILGKLAKIEGFIGSNMENFATKNDWVFNRKNGGGALFETGCHFVDYIAWFGGDPESITAEIKKVKLSVDDYADVSIKFKTGILGHLVVNWVNPEPRRDIKIIGEKGDLVLDFVKNAFFINIWGKGIFKTGPKMVHIPDASSYQLQLQAFVDRILGRSVKLPDVTIFDGIKNVEIISSAYKQANMD
jgi:predicted dehydrogenase